MQESIVKSVNEVKIGDRIKDPNCSWATDSWNKAHQEYACYNTTNIPLSPPTGQPKLKGKKLELPMIFHTIKPIYGYVNQRSCQSIDVWRTGNAEWTIWTEEINKMAFSFSSTDSNFRIILQNLM